MSVSYSKRFSVRTYCREACILIFITAAMAVGCGDSRFEYAPVSGKILLDGQPVAGARVVFMPQSSSDDGEAGPYSNGETNEQGHYVLNTTTENAMRGAVVGSHRIIVSTKKAHLDPNDPDIEIIDVQESIPYPYYDYRRTTLEFEVTLEGSDSADFSLESKQGRR